MNDTTLPPRRPVAQSVAASGIRADAYAEWLDALRKVLPATVTVNSPAELADYLKFVLAQNNQLAAQNSKLTRDCGRYKRSLQAVTTAQAELVND